MNNLLTNIKEKNNNTLKKSGSLLLKIEGIMVLLGIVLLVIDSDQFITIAVLLIFFAIVLGIVTLFLTLKNAMNNYLKKIDHSIDIAYKNYVDQYNHQNGTAYTVSSQPEAEGNWFLIPSYANKSAYYKLSDETIKMYHAETFNITSADQRKTYYFKGLYMILPGPSGDMQYRDKETFSEKIIESLKEFYRKDEHDLSLYQNKEQYQSGTLYSQKSSKISPVLETLIPLIKEKPFVSSVRIGQKNNQLHIAIVQKEIRLPFVKKYQEVELDRIKQTINENLELLDMIKEAVEKHIN